MRTLEDLTASWRGALILITDASGSAWRPAAFVFDTEGGFAWVEPSYADPAGAGSPALHVRDWPRIGERTFEQGGMRIEILPYTPGLDTDLVGDALEWFADWLQAEGRTWAAERERVRAMLASG